MRACWERLIASSSMRADGLERVSARRGLFGKAANRRFADECDVAERMFGEPWIDEFVLELGPGRRRHGNRTADLPHLVDESTRDLDGFGLECAEGACARAVAKELIHLACEDPRVDEGTDRLQPKARFSHLGYCAGPPEQGVAPDGRIGSPSLDRRGREIDFRGERDRVLVHAHPQRFHAEVGPDFRPGRQIGSRAVSYPGRRMPQGRTGRGMRPCASTLHDSSAGDGVELSTDPERWSLRPGEASHSCRTIATRKLSSADGM